MTKLRVIYECIFTFLLHYWYPEVSNLGYLYFSPLVSHTTLKNIDTMVRPKFLPEHKKSPSFVLIAKLLFQNCHRNKGNLVLFHYLTNKICAPVILVLLLTNVLPTIKLWLYKKIRCQFIHWINQGYIGVVLHMPGCFPIQHFFFCTDL